MQEHQFAGDSGQRAASWYLARGDKRYGPLGDRELLLLAEKGGLKTDDLLWKPGFETWKPVHAVCGVGASARGATQDKPQPSALSKDAEYLPTGEAIEPSTQADSLEASDAGQAPKRSLKARLYGELKSFLLIFAYLWLVFFVFLVHEWTVLASNHIGFKFYGLALVNALVLSKIMLIAEAFKFADRLDDKPLIYPIAFKAIAFGALLMVSYVAEEILVGLYHGKSAAESFPQVGGGGLVGIVTIGAILCVALVPFFAFREIARVIGAAEFRALMLGPAKNAQDDDALVMDAAAKAA